MRSDNRFFTRPLVWLALLLLCLYAGLSRFTPASQFTDVVQIAQITVSAWAMVTVGGVALRCFTGRGWPHPDDLVGLGIFVTSLGINWNGAWGLFYRLAGEAPWLINNDIYGAWRALVIIGIIIKLIAIGIFGGSVPRSYKLRHGALWMLAFALVIYLALARPDLRPLAEWLRPYLETAHDFPRYVQNAGVD
ncbi:hypothetical protein [Methylobacterium nodulans]|uniref:Transmembrane protein n=1 Tax=Methylobacterium nodulans (strain LMG 21967 / CNCM I-2342 / ORS 2060) TaxID=460265 RepID=B8IIX7_METNO|nr:hypothetical protein [Methylobacterium nodulans]ACL61772.1 hypothetical protein Mnod_7031 [Methylobacterium nodulans ORS 2060]